MKFLLYGLIALIALFSKHLNATSLSDGDCMKQVVVLRHVPFENLGYFEQCFKDNGFKITYVDAGKDDLSVIEKNDPEILVVCGGPISVNDEDLYPFLHDEFRIVKERIKQKRATLGLCLGAQVIAKVLGSKIYPGKSKEIGWFPITLTDEGKNSSLRFLGQEGIKDFHWHGETFDLPHNAVLLASTSICTNQAFSYGEEILAIQFHPEVTPEQLEQWYIGHTCELGQLKNISIAELRQDAKKYGKELRKQGEKFLNEWLEKVAIEKSKG